MTIGDQEILQPMSLAEHQRILQAARNRGEVAYVGKRIPQEDIIKALGDRARDLGVLNNEQDTRLWTIVAKILEPYGKKGFYTVGDGFEMLALVEAIYTKLKQGNIDPSVAEAEAKKLFSGYQELKNDEIAQMNLDNFLDRIKAATPQEALEIKRQREEELRLDIFIKAVRWNKTPKYVRYVLEQEMQESEEEQSELLNLAGSLPEEHPFIATKLAVRYHKLIVAKRELAIFEMPDDLLDKQITDALEMEKEQDKLKGQRKAGPAGAVEDIAQEFIPEFMSPSQKAESVMGRSITEDLNRLNAEKQRREKLKTTDAQEARKQNEARENSLRGKINDAQSEFNKSKQDVNDLSNPIYNAFIQELEKRASNIEEIIHFTKTMNEADVFLWSLGKRLKKKMSVVFSLIMQIFGGSGLMIFDQFSDDLGNPTSG